MNVLELIFAFWLGRATKGANPLALMASFFLALALIGLMIGMCVLVWHFSPQAAHVVRWAGIAHYLPFLDLSVHDVGAQDTGAIIMELPSRLVLCSVALLVIGVLCMAAIWLMNFATTVAVKVVKLVRDNARA